LPSAGMRCDDATILFVEFDDLEVGLVLYFERLVVSL